MNKGWSVTTPQVGILFGGDVTREMVYGSPHEEWLADTIQRSAIVKQFNNEQRHKQEMKRI